MPSEWRDPSLADRSRRTIITGETGGMAALAVKLLKDMGFAIVRILKSGSVAWQGAGYPIKAL